MHLTCQSRAATYQATALVDPSVKKQSGKKTNTHVSPEMMALTENSSLAVALIFR